MVHRNSPPWNVRECAGELSCPAGLGAGSVVDGALGRSIRRHVEAYDRPMWSSYRTTAAPGVRNFPRGGQIPLASDVPILGPGVGPVRPGLGKRPRAAR